MRALIDKEIRLLLPAFAAALVLAIVPVWLLPNDHWNPQDYSVYFFCFGVALLPLSTFGREISFKTLPFMLAQPLDRLRIWRSKAAVLAVLVAMTFDGWWLSRRLSSLSHPDAARVNIAYALAFVAVLTAGALWMTLLLRQVMAAFWLSLLIPIVTVIVVEAAGGPQWVIIAVLGVSAVAGFFMARREFVYLQDTAWTGGIVTFGQKRAVAADTISRERGPLRALIAKELKLQEFTLAGIAALFVLHLGTVVLRKVGVGVFSPTTLAMLEMFGGVWLFVPLVAGSQSVAEERQLGTMDGLLILPVSRRTQFWIKLSLVLVLGGLLSPALLYAVERIARVLGAPDPLIPAMGTPVMFLVFVAASLSSFYASTLTRGVVQGLAAGVILTFAYCRILPVGSNYNSPYTFGSAYGPLEVFLAVTVAVVWLAYGNFRWLLEAGRQSRRNVIGLFTVIVLTSAATEGVYYRTWELAMPLEGAHGAPRLPTEKRVLIRGYGGTGLAIVLPDGRLWTDRVVYDGGWLSLGGNKFVPGTNWVDAFADSRDIAAIKTDGTLWVSERPLKPWVDDHHPQPEVTPPLVQFGVESNWVSLRRYPTLLLKRDGTLWLWETNDVGNKHYEGLHFFAPKQMGTDSDWARMDRGTHSAYAWKQNGDAWALFTPEPGQESHYVRLPCLDHVHFASIATYPCSLNVDIAVRDDGTMWYWRCGDYWGGNANPLRPSPKLAQIGKDSDWVAVAGGGYELVAMKTDGSLWKWNIVRGRQTPTVLTLQEAPERLGTHTDWVGLTTWYGQATGLSADGTLWSLPRTDAPPDWILEGSEKCLGLSRRAAPIENIFGGDLAAAKQ